MQILAGLTNTRNADAVVVNHNDNKTYFVKPLERDESFTNFVRDIRAQEFSDPEETSNVKYSQARELHVQFLELNRLNRCSTNPRG